MSFLFIVVVCLLNAVVSSADTCGDSRSYRVLLNGEAAFEVNATGACRCAEYSGGGRELQIDANPSVQALLAKIGQLESRMEAMHTTILEMNASLADCRFGPRTTGSSGSTGSSGTTGSVGSTGSTGSLRSTGSTGSVRSTGSTGSTGSVGSTGSTGSTGTTGAPPPPSLPANVSSAAMLLWLRADRNLTISGGKVSFGVVLWRKRQRR
eukprot:TRINITY_DN7292_c0_g1_i1.p2 TRINITY_DN7292_c0_g1~~TRINITY_DN7292_c0_g1_i1.p2  ORF type:complete len:209 (+),score=82.58 TRINITY_DN7292_c0_g1_i1:107-733(+)